MSVMWNSKMNLTLKPSLKHMTLSRIAISLWNLEVSSFLGIHPVHYVLTREWQIIEDRVLGKVPQLPLPQPLKEKVSSFIKPIGIEIYYWIRYHLIIDCYISGILPNDLCWAPQGTIDKKKTAEVLIQNENLDITNRYLLACVYCLEDEIPGLWKRIPDNVRNTEDFTRRSMFVEFWTNYIHYNFEKTPSFRAMLDLSLLRVNKTALAYFLPKLTSSERDEFFSRFVQTYVDSFLHRESPHGRHYFFDALSFLFSHMNEQQQAEFFKTYSFIVLRYFLEWPRQSFFMEMANCLWDYINDLSFHALLENILQKVISGFMDYNYQQLFVEFWRKSSDALKSFVLHTKCIKRALLYKMLEIKDKTNIKLIVEDAALPGKEKIILEYGSLLEFFVRECNISKNELMKLKEECIEFTDEQHEKWLKFIEQLDDRTDENYKRKRTTEGENSSAKRLRGSESD